MCVCAGDGGGCISGGGRKRDQVAKGCWIPMQKVYIRNGCWKEQDSSSSTESGNWESLDFFLFFCQWDHQSPSVSWKESWRKEATWLCSVSHPRAQSPLCITGSESGRRKERMNICLPNLGLVRHLSTVYGDDRTVLFQWIPNLVWPATHHDPEYTAEPFCTSIFHP